MSSFEQGCCKRFANKAGAAGDKDGRAGIHKIIYRKVITKRILLCSIELPGVQVSDTTEDDKNYQSLPLYKFRQVNRYHKNNPPIEIGGNN